MCDYSAKHVQARAAVKEEKLVTRQISPHTKGFVGINDQSIAVCLLPGTELAFEQTVKLASINLHYTLIQSIRMLFRMKKVVDKAASNQKVATFVQINKHQESAHHDALEFPDGTQVLLNDLVFGQIATVVQLPADPATLEGKAREEATEMQRRAAYT